MARSELTLAFVGSGKVERRNAFALLKDLIDAEGGNVKFIFPLTKTYWNEALEVVSAYALDNGIPVEAVVDDSTSKVKELKALLTGARRQHQSAAVPNKVASLLEEARNGKLIVLWDDEDEAALEVVRVAHEKGVALLELTRGLDRIELVTGDDDGDAEDEGAGQEMSDEEIPAEIDDDGEAEDDAEIETVEEFEETEAEDDLDAGADLPEEDDAEASLPEEDDDVAVMENEVVEEIRTTGMSEFQRRLLVVLEQASAAFVAAVNAVLADEAPAPVKMAVESKTSARKSTAPVKKTAPPKKAAAAPAKKSVAPPVKRTVPKKTTAPAKAESNGDGAMTKAAAQKIIDGYRPRRGRPPAEVTEARKVLGLS